MQKARCPRTLDPRRLPQVVNFLVVHLKETTRVISAMQKVVQDHPLKGFWLVSAAALMVAPFLTNDGVCLLFVQVPHQRTD